MDYQVLKFGGTSVGTGERLLHVAGIIESYLLLKIQPVVVLSAMSGSVKTLGTTSRLLDACKEVLKEDSNEYLAIVDSLESSHCSEISNAFKELNDYPAGNLEHAIEEIKKVCSKLRAFMLAAEVIDEMSPRSQDFIISAGEKLSAILFASLAKAKGINTKLISLEKLITKKFRVNEIGQSFYEYVGKRLHEEISPYIDTHVCVVTGYLGPVPGGIMKTFGRGYTDLTAALIAVSFNASELQIWKEVDGIFSADPRKCPLARKIDAITPEEAAELTYYGSEVIHPFTMEQAIRASIPIRIKNTFKPEGAGTIILPEGHRLQVIKSLHKLDKLLQATAVTIKENMIILNVHSNRISVSHGFFAEIFMTLDKYGIVVDLISTSEVHISMALNPKVTPEILQNAISDLKIYGNVDVKYNMAILSLVGKNMRNMVGIANRMFHTLSVNKVNIEMISQGASEINISCVIEEHAAERALRAVHDVLIIGVDSA